MVGSLRYRVDDIICVAKLAVERESHRKVGDFTPFGFSLEENKEAGFIYSVYFSKFVVK